MVINLRPAAGMAAIWAVAIAGVSATAWLAIDRAGRDITNASVNTLIANPQLTAATAAEPTDTEPAPTRTPTPGPSVASPPSAAPAPSATPRHRESGRHSETPGSSTAQTPEVAQVRSVTVQGGQVTVHCLGTGIRLQVAQPESGWRVHVDKSESGQIVVSFRTSEQEDGHQTRVTSRCREGIPVFDTSQQMNDE